MRRAGMLGFGLGPGLVGPALVGLGVALSLATGQALAVDVDRIEIHSRLGEPLVAEILIVGATPAELTQVQAQLASPTTFARIGLPRPQGVVVGLRFEVLRGPRPVIRVTSDQPVQEEFLTFLMQVDAPQGRLVREYSLALGAEPSMQAPLAPEIQAPAAAPAATIARQPDPADALPAPVVPLVDAPASVAPETAAPPIAVVGRTPPPAAATNPIPLHGDRASARTAAARPAAVPAPVAASAQGRPAAPRPAPAPSPQPVAAAPGSGAYPVRRGDTLTGVVARMGIEGATLPQSMLAVLRTNPQAFGAGNINLLHQGVVLRKPAASELTRLDPAAAEALVRLQTEQWRGGELPPVVAPAALSQVAAAAAAPIPVAAEGVAPARLEIAPAGAEGSEGAGQSGSATGSNLAQRERAAADLVAARYTEFQQMQQRIAELEQTQKAQQRLLELKDRQLAAQRPQTAGAWPWLIALIAVAAALASLWRSRGPQRPGRVATALAARVHGAGDTGAEKPAR